MVTEVKIKILLLQSGRGNHYRQQFFRLLQAQLAESGKGGLPAGKGITEAIMLRAGLPVSGYRITGHRIQVYRLTAAGLSG